MSAARLLALLGTDFDVDVSGLIARLRAARAERATVSLTHAFDRLGVTVSVPLRELAAATSPEQAARVAVLAEGHGDLIEVTYEVVRGAEKRIAIAAKVLGTRALEGDLATLAAAGVEPKVIEGVRAAITELGAEQLVAATDTVGGDGARGWELRVAQQNHAETLRAATKTRVDRVAMAAGVTPAQRRIAGSLHDSLAREMLSHVWLRGSRRVLAPAVGVVWDRVEWQPIQRMVSGFHPAGDPAARIAALARASDTELATVELVLGPTDPPGMRMLVTVEGAGE